MSVAQSGQTLFVTTALPYANGPFHIGHIMEYIQADIWVRFQRMQGHRVHFVCADDTHGAPIMLAAEAEGVTPQALVARIAATRPKHLAGFHVSFDHWHSTDSPENVELSQDVYRRLKAAGLIYAKPVEQFFDPVKSMFLPDRYIKGTCPVCGTRDQYGDACENCSSTYAPTDLIDPYSTLTGARPELRTSEHLFFRLSDPACVAFLREWTAGSGAGGEPRLQMEVLNKAREWLGGSEGKLADWDISRDAPYFGIPIPDEPGKYFYVWLDAPIGYLASLKAYVGSGKAKTAGETRSFEQILSAPDTRQIHFIGKDIIYFHTLFWPAMLKFAGAPYKVPDNIYVHGFITFTGEKMSKSPSPASTAISSASTSISRAARRRSSRASSAARCRRACATPPSCGGTEGPPSSRGQRRTLSPTRTRSANSARCCAKRCASPIASTSASIRRSRGSSQRIRRAVTSCTTSARMRSSRFAR